MRSPYLMSWDYSGSLANHLFKQTLLHDTTLKVCSYFRLVPCTSAA